MLCSCPLVSMSVPGWLVAYFRGVGMDPDEGVKTQCFCKVEQPPTVRWLCGGSVEEELEDVASTCTYPTRWEWWAYCAAAAGWPKKSTRLLRRCGLFFSWLTVFGPYLYDVCVPLLPPLSEQLLQLSRVGGQLARY